MFKFLKEKLKSAISIFSKKAEEPAGVEEEEKEEKPLIQKKFEPQKEIKHEKPKDEKLEEKKEIRHEEVKRKEKPHKEIERTEIKREEKPVPRKHEEVGREERAHIVEKEETTKKTIEEERRIEEKPGFFQKLKERFAKPTEKPSPKEEEEPEIVAEPRQEKQIRLDEHKIVEQEKKAKPAEKEIEPMAEESRGFFQKLKEKVQTVTISEEKFNEMFWDLEVAMLENNVAVEVIDKIKNDLKERLVERPIRRGAVERSITDSLTKSIRDLFKDYKSVDLVELAKKKKPFVICFVGVNGSGKTTTIAKVAYLLKKHNLSVVIAAADTFRAAAIDQLQLHADALGVKLIKQDYGSDAAAVAFDAVKHAESKNKDVVLIDTAGRLHSNANLMDEMKKVVRVAKPDMVIFVGESITGNDCVEQARMFSEAVQIDGIILSKADVDEKGGAAISISHVTHKPILYIGTGQEYQDLQRVDPTIVIESLGLAS